MTHGLAVVSRPRAAAVNAPVPLSGRLAARWGVIDHLPTMRVVARFLPPHEAFNMRRGGGLVCRRGNAFRALRELLRRG